MSQFPSLAARNVNRNRRRSAVTLMAILIGVALITVLRGFTSGVGALMIDDVVRGRTGALQVHRAGFVASIESLPLKLSMPQSPELLARIRHTPGVTGVAGRIQFSGLVGNGVSQTLFAGRAIDPAEEKAACPRSGFEVLPGGSPLAPGDTAAALIGYELAQSFHAVTPEQKRATNAIGDVDFLTLQSSSPEGRANSIDVTVKGLMSSNLPFENRRVLTLPLSTAQQLLGMEGKVTEYAVAIADLDQLDAVAAALRTELGPEFEVHTWKELQPFIRDVINRQNYVLGGVAVVLFIIVLTGIINTMLMSVFERVREIGTMLAVGVRRRQILLLFVLEAGVIGLLGGAAGALVGQTLLAIAAAKGIPLKLAGTSGQSLLRPAVSLSFVGLSVAIALAGALLAAAYPAWKASRLNPVDALRSL